MTTRARRVSRDKIISKGWGAIDNPVPGDVLGSLAELGVSLHKITTDEAWALCPAHLERTGKADRHPSWSVNIDTGLHSCLSCGYRGNFPGLVRDLLKLNRADAAAWVRQRGALAYVQRRMAPVVEKERAPVNEAALALFTDPPLAACSKRLLHPDACAYYGVLWDPKKERWITPIRDPDDGTLRGYQEKAARYFRNRPSDVVKSTTLFGLNKFTGKRAILVESPLDVVRLRSVGISGGLSGFGVVISEFQMSLLMEVSEQIVLALDNDRDGRKVTEEILETYGSRHSFLVFNYAKTPVKDPGEMGSDEIHWALRNATPGLRARINKIKARVAH